MTLIYWHLTPILSVIYIQSRSQVSVCKTWQKYQVISSHSLGRETRVVSSLLIGLQLLWYNLGFSKCALAQSMRKQCIEVKLNWERVERNFTADWAKRSYCMVLQAFVSCDFQQGLHHALVFSVRRKNSTTQGSVFKLAYAYYTCQLLVHVTFFTKIIII